MDLTPCVPALKPFDTAGLKLCVGDDFLFDFDEELAGFFLSKKSSNPESQNIKKAKKAKHVNKHVSKIPMPVSSGHKIHAKRTHKDKQIIAKVNSPLIVRITRGELDEMEKSWDAVEYEASQRDS